MSQKVKKSSQVLLFPGAEGWEIWSGMDELVLRKASGEREALAVDGVPGGVLTMAFPVRDVSAAPFVAATGDKEMFSDLSDLHLERSGLRVDQTAGSLSDCFTLRVEAEEAVLLPVVLAPPPEGGLPKKSPKAFDVSARCLPLPKSAVVLWREFGRWVFAVSDAESRCVYFQALPGALFDPQLSREVALGVAQLAMQEVLAEPLIECQVWTSEGEIAPSLEAMQSLSEVLKMPVHSRPKPAPKLPKKISSLLPADIRAERVAMQKARQTKLAVAAVVVGYLGLVGWLAYQYFDAGKKTELAKKSAESSSPEAKEFTDFKKKWEELQPVVENEYYPLDQYYNAYLAAPKQGLRLTEVEAHNEVEFRSNQGAKLQRYITLRGQSDEAAQAIEFGSNLEKGKGFETFEWEINSPTKTSSGVWSFMYRATAL